MRARNLVVTLLASILTLTALAACDDRRDDRRDEAGPKLATETVRFALNEDDSVVLFPNQFGLIVRSADETENLKSHFDYRDDADAGEFSGADEINRRLSEATSPTGPAKGYVAAVVSANCHAPKSAELWREGNNLDVRFPGDSDKERRECVRAVLLYVLFEVNADDVRGVTSVENRDL